MHCVNVDEIIDGSGLCCDAAAFWLSGKPAS